MVRKVFFEVLLTSILALTIAGCGGGGDSSGSDSSTTTTVKYSISGTVSGLTGSGLVLQNNGGNDLTISGDGDFTFSTEVTDGKSYSVSVASQPGSPTQTCTVTNASGTVSGADVSDVQVTCIDSYTISGTVSGLDGTGLELQNNSGDNLTIESNGTFTFSTGVIDVGSYSVSVYANPTSLSQTCSVTNGSGTVSSANVTDVSISCTTDSFAVGGSVSGLAGSGLVLDVNDGPVSISSNGTFSLGSMTDGNIYLVQIKTQPTSPDQKCSVSNGSGTVSGAEVSNIEISCATLYTVGGSISGIVSGSTVVLQNNGGDDLTLTSDGAFTFGTSVVDGAVYSVDVGTQPTATKQYCNVVYGSGTMASANVSDIEVSCVDGLYNVVDTNQTECYNSTTGATRTCTGAGEDAEHDGLQPNYTSYSVVSGEDVVLDNNTGLMWQASSDTDGVSGLDINDKMTPAEAVSYCEALDYGSYSDWRLPNIKELYSIYLMSGMDLSGKPGATSNGTTVDHTGIEPFIDTAYFDIGYGDTSAGERAIDGQYISSTDNIAQDYSGITYAWEDTTFGVNFVDGHIKPYERYASGAVDAAYYVRCVRGNPDYGNNDFSDNGDSTVTDNATNLMWEQGDSHSNDFDDAMSVCSSATTGSHSDWRLPNAKELQSIVDYSNAPGITGNPSIDTAYFNSTSFTNEAGDNPDYAYYWSSSALINSSGKGNSGAYITFGRGLGYLSNMVVDVHGAGAQRADNKTTVALSSLTSIDVSSSSCTFGDTAYSSGPQGDIKRIVNNYVRCVRDK